MALTDWDISVCGLNCARCDLRAEGNCGGCRGPAEPHWSANCVLLSCSRTRHLKHCFECQDFPCKDLLAFANDGYAHHAAAVENLKRMREIGLEEWLRQQDRPSFCPGCRG